MNIALDTNAYSALMHNNSKLVAIIEKADSIYTSTIVVGELLYGFYNGKLYQENQKMLDDFLASDRVHLLQATYKTADYFGHIFSQLRKIGKKIPTNDIWIAAHTFEAEATLLSFDKHFHHIADLPLHTVANP